MQFAKHLKAKGKAKPAPAISPAGMPPSDTPQPAEEKMGAKMAKAMPTRKTFGQRIAQREK